jgi:hypothetical protein
MQYIKDRGNEPIQKIGKTDLAFSVARQHNAWVSDATAHKYWCAIYDLEQEGRLQFDFES